MVHADKVHVGVGKTSQKSATNFWMVAVSGTCVKDLRQEDCDVIQD